LLARENPNRAEFQVGLARSQSAIGSLQRDKGDLSLALGWFGKALATSERLAVENPSVTAYRADLANIHNNIGVLHTAAGHFGQALESFGKALVIWERLRHDNPTVTEILRSSAECHANIGNLQRNIGRPDMALESSRKALAIQERLVRDYPGLPAYASDLGATLNNIATIDLAMKRYDRARDSLREAISWQEKALAANPSHPTYRQFLRNHLTNLIEAAKGLGDDEEARASQRELDELATNDPAKAGLDQRLAAVTHGETPKDNSERLQLAYRAYERRLYAASTRLYGDALGADQKLADDRQAQHRYNAACTAALAAASGTGHPDRQETSGRTEKPLTDADRAKFRNQARGWLEAELATWAKLLRSAQGEQGQAIAKTLEHWQQDTDLASVRDEAGLAQLPDDERKAWKSLWTNVDALLAKARNP
jgi:tetratricopeptide (TPR) repeat protein